MIYCEQAYLGGRPILLKAEQHTINPDLLNALEDPHCAPSKTNLITKKTHLFVPEDTNCSSISSDSGIYQFHNFFYLFFAEEIVLFICSKRLLYVVVSAAKVVVSFLVTDGER